MEPYELSDLSAELRELEKFLSDLAAHEADLAIQGGQGVRLWDTYSPAEGLLREAESRLVALLSVARPIDYATWNALNNLIGSGQFAEALGKIYIWISIESRRRRRGAFGALVAFAARLFVRNPMDLFAEHDLPVRSALTTIHRLVPLVDRLHRLYYTQRMHDDRLFQPSSLDPTRVVEYIEATISFVRIGAMRAEDRELLLKHLESAKTELASETPSWKAVLGALVVVSALISGLADLPDASDNLKKAVQYVLGAISSPQTTERPVLPKEIAQFGEGPTQLNDPTVLTQT